MHPCGSDRHSIELGRAALTVLPGAGARTAELADRPLLRSGPDILERLERGLLDAAVTSAPIASAVARRGAARGDLRVRRKPCLVRGSPSTDRPREPAHPARRRRAPAAPRYPRLPRKSEVRAGPSVRRGRLVPSARSPARGSRPPDLHDRAGPWRDACGGPAASRAIERQLSPSLSQ